MNVFDSRKESLPAISDLKSVGQSEKLAGKTGAKDAAEAKEGPKEPRDANSQ